MKPQVIKTEAGEELVVLTRRAYDALLARGGDEAAEARMTALMAEDHLAHPPAGAPVPLWFVKLVAEHGSPVTAARRHKGRDCTQAVLAEALGISQGHLSDIERDRRSLTDQQRTQIAEHTGVEGAWLD